MKQVPEWYGYRTEFTRKSIKPMPFDCERIASLRQRVCLITKEK
jgi:hypothetical protein